MLLVAVLHFISDEDDPATIVTTIRDALLPGGYLVVSHVAGDIRQETSARAAVHYKKVSSGATVRTREEILRFFTGQDLIEPGLVQVPHWRAEDEPADAGKVWISAASAASQVSWRQEERDAVAWARGAQAEQAGSRAFPSGGLVLRLPCAFAGGPGCSEFGGGLGGRSGPVSSVQVTDGIDWQVAGERVASRPVRSAAISGVTGRESSG